MSRNHEKKGEQYIKMGKSSEKIIPRGKKKKKRKGPVNEGKDF